MSASLSTAPHRLRIWRHLPMRSIATATTGALLLTLGAAPHDMPPLTLTAQPCDSISYGYDAAGRLVAVRDAAGQTARYHYDPADNLLDIVNEGTTDLTIFALTPASGPTGSQVTITGGCFATQPEENQVTFNGTPAQINDAEPGRLVVTVPAQATTGFVTVQVGTTVATSQHPFTVEGSQAPTITAVSPTLVQPGDLLTITGSNFDPLPTNTITSLNRTRPQVVSASVDVLEVEVPAAVASGKVRVQTVNGSAISAEDVFVAPAPYGIGDVAYAARTPLDQSQAVTIPTAGHIALLIFDLDAGERVAASLSSSTFGFCGLTARVLDPFGTQLAPASCVGSNSFLDRVTANVAGTYTLLLTSSAAGSLTVTLHDVPPDPTVTVTPGDPEVTLTTTVPGQRAVVQFQGTTGQRISIQAWGGTVGFSNTRLHYTDPDGLQLANLSCHTTCFIDTHTLAATGTYTATWNPEGARTGSITIQVQEEQTLAGWSEPVARQRTAIGGGHDVLSPEDFAPELPQSAGRRHDPAELRWVPDRYDLAHGWWRSQRFTHPGTYAATPAAAAEPGVTALSGQVLLLNGQPLPGLPVSIGEASARTDHQGRFLLTHLEPGHHVLAVDGNLLDRGRGTFGRHEIGVDLTAGHTTTLPFPIWLSSIDTTNAVTISSPTTEDTVITTPLIPNLELRLPAGTVIRDRGGDQVTRVSLTPVPLDQPPFPLPAGVATPVYFTMQPGGAVILPEGAQIIYPNTTGLAPGTRVEFWDYDPYRAPCTNPPAASYPRTGQAQPRTAPAGCALTGPEAGWYTYGHGTVTDDATQIVPDPGVTIHEFTGTMINAPGLRSPDEGPGEDGAAGGDPVDLGTGLFVETHTDLVVDDLLPISITRTYRPRDHAMRPFGIGTNFTYGIFLESAQQYQEADLVFPDGGTIHFIRTSSGTGFTDAVFQAVGSTGAFRDAVLAWNGNGWDLTRTDGMVFVFGDERPLQAIRDRHGNQITLTRTNGQGGDIVQITAPSGGWIRLDYHQGTNRIATATDNAGRTVQYGYDAEGRLVSVTSPGGRTISYAYDAEHQMTSITDPRGITYLTNAYDSEGRVASQQLAGGASYQFDYTTDQDGNITRTLVTQPDGTVSEVGFDDDGRVIFETHALGTPLARTSTMTRDPATRLPTTLVDPHGQVTELGYDGDGNLTSITSRAGTADARTVTIDPNGPFRQPRSITDQHGRRLTMTYDGQGNLTSVTDAEGRVSTFTYNFAGQVTTATDPAGHTTTYAYESGHLAAVTDPLGRTTRSFVDAVGRPVAVTDPSGATERVSLDLDSALLSHTDALGHVTLFDYDANGNLTSVTDPRGHTTTFTYDDADLPVAVQDPLGGLASRNYDPVGRLVAAVDRNGGTTTYGYDALGRLTSVGYPDGSSRTLAFDSLDRLASINDSAAGLLTLNYNDLDQVTSIAAPGGTIDYGYDAAGRRVSMTVPGQPGVSYTYEDTDLIESLSQGGQTATWQRDAAGRVTSLEIAGVVAAYDYDAAGQLTSIAYQTTAGNPIGDLHYTYDPAGRVVAASGSLSQVAIPATSPAMTYDAANRLTARGGQSLSYDAEGRLLHDGTFTYTWNARGELTNVTGAGTDVAYTYDPVGRRATRTNGGATTSYRYDGPNLVQELTGGQVTADRLVAGLDQTLLRADATGTRTPLTDRLGSIIGLVNPDGTLATGYTYQPYGAVTATGTASGNTQTFTSREHDPDTGLLYYRARYYHPELGRFLSQDPAGFGGGSTNLYHYALADPTNLTDPYGDAPPVWFSCGMGYLVSAGFTLGIGMWKASALGRKYTFWSGLRDLRDNLPRDALSCGVGTWLQTGVYLDIAIGLNEILWTMVGIEFRRMLQGGLQAPPSRPDGMNTGPTTPWTYGPPGSGINAAPPSPWSGGPGGATHGVSRGAHGQPGPAPASGATPTPRRGFIIIWFGCPRGTEDRGHYSRPWGATAHHECEAGLGFPSGPR
jgi:RHS repeat-associated protein